MALRTEYQKGVCGQALVRPSRFLLILHIFTRNIPMQALSFITAFRIAPSIPQHLKTANCTAQLSRSNFLATVLVSSHIPIEETFTALNESRLQSQKNATFLFPIANPDHEGIQYTLCTHPSHRIIRRLNTRRLFREKRSKPIRVMI